MSRCFSYPPPGYSVSEGGSQALIESIKLQNESVLAKAETKKDRKREKKERRKDKKAKSKTCLSPRRKIHKSSSTCLKFTSLQKLVCNENEQLEGSSLTEEHAQPTGEQKPSTSSDSTQNSSKRKREASPPAVVKHDGNSIRSNGNVIRIRLSSRKQNAVVSGQEPCSATSSHEQDAAIIRRQQCSTSGRSELVTHNKHQESQDDSPSIQQGINNVISVHPPRPQVDIDCSASLPRSVIREGSAAVLSQLPENKLPIGGLPPRPDGEGCSTLGIANLITPADDIAVRDPTSRDKKKVKADLRFRDLFLNWVPPPLQSEIEADDEDWLFSKKKKVSDNTSEKKPEPSSNLFFGSSSSLWPRAQFIPEADIYALPLTVPF